MKGMNKLAEKELTSFRTPEINQHLAATQEVFSQEKQLNLSKNSKHCPFNFAQSCLPHPSSDTALETEFALVLEEAEWKGALSKPHS